MPKTILDESISEVKAAIYSANRRNNATRSSVDSTGEALDKISLKLDRLTTEIEKYKARLERDYARKERELVDQIIKLYKLLEQYEIEDLHKQVDSVEESRGLKVACTVAIMENFVDLVSGDFDSFKTMSKATIYTNVYQKLFETNNFLLDKVPEGFEGLVENGRKFVKENILPKVHTSLEKPDLWDDYIGEVDRWWKEKMLPYLFLEVNPELEFDEDPASLQDMIDSNKIPARQHELFPEVADAMNFLKGRVQEAYEVSGLTDALVRLKSSGIG